MNVRVKDEQLKGAGFLLTLGVFNMNYLVKYGQKSKVRTVLKS